MFHRTARVTEHVRLADRTYRVRLDCPDLAAAIRPGQFVMLRLPNTSDPLLGRLVASSLRSRPTRGGGLFRLGFLRPFHFFELMDRLRHLPNGHEPPREFVEIRDTDGVAFQQLAEPDKRVDRARCKAAGDTLGEPMGGKASRGEKG